MFTLHLDDNKEVCLLFKMGDINLCSLTKLTQLAGSSVVFWHLCVNARIMYSPVQYSSR